MDSKFTLNGMVQIRYRVEDGKFDWICTVPGQGKIDLFLQYEVTAPLRASISGLGFSDRLCIAWMIIFLTDLNDPS